MRVLSWALFVIGVGMVALGGLFGDDDRQCSGTIRSETSQPPTQRVVLDCGAPTEALYFQLTGLSVVLGGVIAGVSATPRQPRSATPAGYGTAPQQPQQAGGPWPGQHGAPRH